MLVREDEAMQALFFTENQNNMDEKNQSEGTAPDTDTAEKAVEKMLKDMPGGFSVAPDGSVTADREAVEVKTIEEFSKLVREPKTVTITLHGGKAVRFRVRPIDAMEQREIDEMDSDAPIPPLKKAPASPSLAQGRQKADTPPEYDWADPDYRKKIARVRELKRAAVISRGLLSVGVPGETVEAKANFLATHFTERVLDAIHNAIAGMSSEPIERALFT